MDFKLPVAHSTGNAVSASTCPSDAFPVDLTDKQCNGLTKSCLAKGPKATGVPLSCKVVRMSGHWRPEAVCAWGGFGPWLLCISVSAYFKEGCGSVQFLSSSVQRMSVEVMRQLQQPAGRRAAP